MSLDIKVFDPAYREALGITSGSSSSNSNEEFTWLDWQGSSDFWSQLSTVGANVAYAQVVGLGASRFAVVWYNTSTKKLHLAVGGISFTDNTLSFSQIHDLYTFTSGVTAIRADSINDSVVIALRSNDSGSDLFYGKVVNLQGNAIDTQTSLIQLNSSGTADTEMQVRCMDDGVYLFAYDDGGGANVSLVTWSGSSSSRQDTQSLGFNAYAFVTVDKIDETTAVCSGQDGSSGPVTAAIVTYSGSSLTVNTDVNIGAAPQSGQLVDVKALDTSSILLFTKESGSHTLLAKTDKINGTTLEKYTPNSTSAFYEVVELDESYSLLKGIKVGTDTIAFVWVASNRAYITFIAAIDSTANSFISHTWKLWDYGNYNVNYISIGYLSSETLVLTFLDTTNTKLMCRVLTLRGLTMGDANWDIFSLRYGGNMGRIQPEYRSGYAKDAGTSTALLNSKTITRGNLKSVSSGRHVLSLYAGGKVLLAYLDYNRSTGMPVLGQIDDAITIASPNSLAHAVCQKWNVGLEVHHDGSSTLELYPLALSVTAAVPTVGSKQTITSASVYYALCARTDTDVTTQNGIVLVYKDTSNNLKVTYWSITSGASQTGSTVTLLAGDSSLKPHDVIEIDSGKFLVGFSDASDGLPSFIYFSVSAAGAVSTLTTNTEISSTPSNTTSYVTLVKVSTEYALAFFTSGGDTGNTEVYVRLLNISGNSVSLVDSERTVFSGVAYSQNQTKYHQSHLVAANTVLFAYGTDMAILTIDTDTETVSIKTETGIDQALGGNQDWIQVDTGKLVRVSSDDDISTSLKLSLFDVQVG